MLKTAFKAATWGLCLLFLILMGLLQSILLLDKSDRIYPSNFSQKVLTTYREIYPKLDVLHNLLIDEYVSGKKSADSVKLVNQLNADIEKLCGDCKIKKLYSPTSYDIAEFKSELDRLSDANLIKNANLYHRISLAFSILVILTAIYLISTLIIFRNNWQKILFCFSLSFPLLLIFQGISSIRSNHKYLYMELGDGDINTWFIIIGLAYLFVGYPVIYALYKKSGLVAKEVIFLR